MQADRIGPEALLLFKGRRRARLVWQRNGQGVLWDRMDMHFVMKVRTRRPAGLPYIANHGAAPHVTSAANPFREARKVRKHRGKAVRVSKHYDVAITSLPSGELDRSSRSRTHRCSKRRSKVDAIVTLPAMRDRVEPMCGERRGHTGEVQWIPRE